MKAEATVSREDAGDGGGLGRGIQNGRPGLQAPIRLLAASVKLWLAIVSGSQISLAAEVRLRGISRPMPDGPVQLEGIGPTNSVYRLERTTDLLNWREWLRLIPETGSFRVQDRSPAGSPTMFYRFSIEPRTAADDWKNQVTVPTDSFLTTDEVGQIRWVKFLILASDPTRVYIQDSQKYLLHFDFAKARIPQFSTSTRGDFDAVSLHLTNQQVILGSLLLPGRTNIMELGVQFAGQEPYPTEWVARYFPLVLEAVDAPGGTTAFYFPAFEQRQAAQMGEEALRVRGIPLGSVYRWLSGDQVYASGWATGPLRFIPATDIAAAYAEGRLRPTDILLTDGIPAEIPFVTGIISLAPATPNSHVALFAGANDVPFAHISDQGRQEQLLAWDGREVIFRAGIRHGYDQVTVADVDGRLDDATRSELLALKSHAPVHITPKQRYGHISATTEALQPEDRRFFGGKAANYGVLRRMVPGNSEPAVAFSFDLWEAFMDQTVPVGNATLREVIRSRLAAFTNYPPDIIAVQTNLAAIRDLITDVTTFAPDQQQAIVHALAPFDHARKIRLRSSSNAEDSKTFVGAGLYDSFSGCLLDDLDDDDKGPCRCDPYESKERGVFRAIRKAYASFYNDNAFLERLRHGIDETQVAMGLLVHHSAPDEVEMANGVAKLHYESQGWGPPRLAGDLVTQLGAKSVTNPDASALPEVVHVTEHEVREPSQASSLVPLGGKVLNFPDDYARLFALMKKVYTNYAAIVGDASHNGPLLDFEYKKIKPGWLQLKQVRELPQDDSAQVDPFLVNEPTTYCVFNREQSRVMADHRLKCLLTLQTRNVRLTGTNLATCFYVDGRFEYRLGDTTHALHGDPSSWPSASHSVAQTSSGRVVQDRWVVGAGSDQRTYVLTTFIPTVNAKDGLVITSRDLTKTMEVTYASPQPDPDVPAGATTTDSVWLIMAPDPATLYPAPPENYQAGGLSVSVSFLLSSETMGGVPQGADPRARGDFPAYYPSWAHATITGLLPEPIVLTNYYATTGTLGHKEAFKWHVFEPGADPSLSPVQRQALVSANIKLIHVYQDVRSREITVRILGTEGKFRPM